MSMNQNAMNQDPNSLLHQVNETVTYITQRYNSNSMPAGYKTLNKEHVQITNSDDPSHFNRYEQRQMRTDDIQGAIPKTYGNNVP